MRAAVEQRCHARQQRRAAAHGAQHSYAGRYGRGISAHGHGCKFIFVQAPPCACAAVPASVCCSVCIRVLWSLLMPCLVVRHPSSN